MAMEITNNYSSSVAQGMAGSNAASSTKKKETENTSETTGKRVIFTCIMCKLRR